MRPIGLLDSTRIQLRRIRHVVRPFIPTLLLTIIALGALWIGMRLRNHIKRRATPIHTRLEIAVLNVGQGEASFARTPDGDFAVVGTGPPGQGEHLVAALRAAGAKHIELLFLPYPYAEAIAGTADVLAAFPVDRVVESGGPAVNHWEEQLRADCTARHIPLEVGIAGNVLPFGTAKWMILAPVPTRVSASPTAANNSLVLRLVYGHTAFVWAGGIEHAGEDALLGRTPNLSANWLRVAHFGTTNASSLEFLQLVSPDDAVISVGENTSDLPSQDTLTRLQATGATIYRTDAATNDLVFFSDGVRLTSPAAP